MMKPNEASSSPTGYSIRVASRLTGISSDTLRMWERRYGFPSPDRNQAGIRVYSDAEIERLILISRALKAGYRAGEVVHTDPQALRRSLANSATARVEATGGEPTVQGLLDAVAEDDPTALRAQLRQAVARLGPKRFVTDVASPLVEAVGEAWATGRLGVRHEHLLTEALSTQLRLLLSAYEGGEDGPIVLLATLPREQHGLGLEMAALYMAVSGAVPRLLGVDSPPDQIVEATRALGATIVGISLSAAASLETTAAHLGWILGELEAGRELWLGGKRSAAIAMEHPQLVRLSHWNELDRHLERVRQSS